MIEDILKNSSAIIDENKKPGYLLVRGAKTHFHNQLQYNIFNVIFLNNTLKRKYIVRVHETLFTRFQNSWFEFGCETFSRGRVEDFVSW